MDKEAFLSNNNLVINLKNNENSIPNIKINNEIYYIKINLIDFSNLNNYEILKLFREKNKINHYSDIYLFILSKENDIRTLPSKITIIKNKKRKSKK